MESLEQISAIILKKDYYLLLGHTDPDGDCLGSLFALKWALDFLGKKSLVLLEEPLDESFAYLGVNACDYHLKEDFKLTWPELNLIALDAGDPSRLIVKQEFLAGHFLINIDHHADNPHYGDLNYVDPNKAAVGEILYHLLNYLGINIPPKIGTAIATSLIADTGGLRYQNTSADVYEIMASLKTKGVDTYLINRALFANQSFAAMKLKGIALASLSRNENGKVAWLTVSQQDLKDTGTDPAAASGLVNYARDIRGVEVGIAFIEEAANLTKVSLRSNDYCPVNEIAAIFGGGGHPRAAGCLIKRKLAEAKKMVLTKVEEYV